MRPNKDRLTKTGHHFVQYNASQGRWVRRRAMVVLSPKEQRVLKLLAQGFNASETASEINRAYKTVEGHIARLCHRMGIADREQLSIAAQQLYGSTGEVSAAPEIDLSSLSDRELQYLVLASEGMNYRVIASKMGVKYKSVWHRIRAIKDKVGIERLGVLRASARQVFAAAARTQS